jgi:hypothetical protein
VAYKSQLTRSNIQAQHFTFPHLTYRMHDFGKLSQAQTMTTFTIPLLAHSDDESCFGDRDGGREGMQPEDPHSAKRLESSHCLDDEQDSSLFVHRMLLRVILPLLLWIQFAVAFASGAASDAISWEAVQWCIACFVLASTVYRQSIALYTARGDADVSLVVYLWPEISTDVILMLVVLTKVETAAIVLCFSTLLLGVNAMLFGCCSACRARGKSANDLADNDEESQPSRRS